jgi:hypothetical protein
VKPNSNPETHNSQPKTHNSKLQNPPVRFSPSRRYLQYPTGSGSPHLPSWQRKRCASSSGRHGSVIRLIRCRPRHPLASAASDNRRLRVTGVDVPPLSAIL